MITGELVRVLSDLPAPFQHQNLTQCMVLEAAVKGDQLVIAAELGLAHKFRGVVLMYLNDNLEYCVRAKIHLQRESVGSLCTVSIFDQETVDIVTNNQSATQKYQVRNLTILNELEVFLNELE